MEKLEASGFKLQNRFTSNLLSNIYHNAGKVDTAKKLIKEKIIEKTDRPFYYYRMAELLEKEELEESRKHLETLFKFWSNADENFIPLKNARALETRLAQL